MEFKDILKNRRTELVLTLQEIADYVGVSKPTVQRWESGNIANLRRDKISRLAEILKTDPAYLMGWTDNPEMITYNIPKKFQKAFSKAEIEILEVAKEAAEEGLTAADFREILRTLKKLKNSGK
jgi:transcriptional regulator with XRE-family HTH domain